MYEYKFYRIDLKIKIRGAVLEEDYQEIVKDHAKQGYRLVQVFAPPIKGYGVADYFELIFERKIQ